MAAMASLGLHASVMDGCARDVADVSAATCQPPPRTGVSPSRRPPAAKHPLRGAHTEPPARPTQGLHPFFMCCGPWAY